MVGSRAVGERAVSPVFCAWRNVGSTWLLAARYVGSSAASSASSGRMSL